MIGKGRIRKVKCKPSSEDASACSECLKRGLKCRIQATKSNHEFNNAPSDSSVVNSDARLERIENLLMQLVKQPRSSLPDSEAPTTIHDSSQEVASQRNASDHLENAPILSLLRNAIVSFFVHGNYISFLIFTVGKR